MTKRQEQLLAVAPLALDTLQAALPYLVLLGDYIGNGTKEDPEGRCKVIERVTYALDSAGMTYRVGRPQDLYITPEHCQYCGNSWNQTRTVGTPRLDAVPCPNCKRLI
jgi:hypothetical protein